MELMTYVYLFGILFFLVFSILLYTLFFRFEIIGVLTYLILCAMCLINICTFLGLQRTATESHSRLEVYTPS